MGVKYTLDVEGHGVFCGRVSLEIRRFTLLVGPNGAGKSLVMLLSWCLDNALAAGFSRYLMSGFDLEEFRRGVLSAFRELADSVVGVGTRVKLGIRSDVGQLSIDYKDVDIRLERRVAEEAVQAAKEKLREYVVLVSGFLKRLGDILGVDEESVRAVSERLGQVYRGDAEFLAPFLILDRVFGGSIWSELPVLFALGWQASAALLSMPVSVYVPDGRAALSKTITSPLFTGGLEAQYLAALLSAVSGETLRVIHRDPVYKTVLEKLGVRALVEHDMSLEVVYQWGGRGALKQAPSGVREALPILLLLAHHDTRRLYIEEPEAHLHPSAVQAVAWASAHSAKQGKALIVSTHDPLIFGQINDLVRASSLTDDKLRVYAEELNVGLDVLKEMLLDPNMVAVNVFRLEERENRVCSIVETVEVRSDGYSEDVFEEIVSLLAAQRAALTALGGS